MARKSNVFDLQKDYCASGALTRIADIDTRFCREIEKTFVQAKLTRTLCFRTKHVPTEIISVIVIPTIRGECATYHNCSEIFHTCLQRNVGSCRDGEICDG